ncbi:MAG: tannase/feruloyl esterase family alpha/beta hydrolase [Burkholderiaceae bacterium]
MRALVAPVLLLAACTAQGPAPSPGPVRASTQAQPASACPALAQQASLPGVRVTASVLVAAGAEKPKLPNGQDASDVALPEHCKVAGRIDERTGADGKPYHTGFELRLPTVWNGRFFYQGGGGNDGIINPAIGRNTGGTGFRDNALTRGFAVVSTDAGHQSPTPEFGLDPQARVEHAYRAHERTALTAKALVAAYYGRGPERSYFLGCSGGGRQGMMFTQRFPDLFDGVIASAPAMRVSEGATIAAAWTVQKFLAVAPNGADGQPVLANALGDANLKRVARGVLDACDAVDGLADGMVQDMAACKPDPAAWQCPAGGDGCLSAPQVSALRDMMAGPRNRAGQALYFGWPWDPGLAAPDWRNWTLGTAQQGAPNARHITLMAGALGHEFVTPPDPALSTLNFDFDRDPPRMQAFHRVYDTADDVQLAGFRARAGKLMFFHGSADPIFSALEVVDYQQRLNSAHGAARAAEFARTFIVPGMTHCAGGPATDGYDGLAAIVAWVEQGRAPERIIAQGTQMLPGVSRPLCPWPQVARYAGGEPKSEASFVCR